MKKSLGVLIIAGVVQANSYGISFAPAPADLGDLDHHFAYSWGMNWNLPAGQRVVSAQLRFIQIYDWQVESDALYIHLLDKAKTGVSTWQENPNDVLADWFAVPSLNLTAIEQAPELTGVSRIHIGTWVDTLGQDRFGTHARDITIQFDATQIAALNTYIQNDGQFGLGFDPDCHYFNNGVTFEIVTSVPDSGHTLLLLSLGLGCLAIVRRPNST